MKFKYSTLLTVCVFFIVSCKKDRENPPPNPETESSLITCYDDIDFTCAAASSDVARVEARLDGQDWCLTEGHDSYEFKVGWGSKDFYNRQTAQVTTSTTVFFSLVPPTTEYGGVSTHLYAKERLLMYFTAPWPQPATVNLSEFMDQYIQVGDLKLQDNSNATEYGTFGFDFECACDKKPTDAKGLWYQSYAGPQQDGYLRCVKKEKRVTATTVEYDLAFEFKLNMYVRGPELFWATFDNGQYNMKVVLPL
jgi:hypothetical protein